MSTSGTRMSCFNTVAAKFSSRAIVAPLSVAIVVARVLRLVLALSSRSRRSHASAYRLRSLLVSLSGRGSPVSVVVTGSVSATLC